MKLLILSSLLFLTACASTPVPVKRNFPTADPIMLEAAPDLKQLPPDTKDLDQLISNAADNYGEYRKLVKRYEMWQQWYKEQKENFDKVK